MLITKVPNMPVLYNVLDSQVIVITQVVGDALDLLTEPEARSPMVWSIYPTTVFWLS